MSQDGDLRLEGKGVRLRPYRAADYPEWAALREGSRGFLQPWEPTWPSDDLTRAAFRRRLAADQLLRTTGDERHPTLMQMQLALDGPRIQPTVPSGGALT